MTEKTAKKYIQNSSKPEKYSWVGIDLFPDGRGWRDWPHFLFEGKNMRLTDLPIGTLFEFKPLSAIYKVIDKKKDEEIVVVEVIDNQQDEFPRTIGEKKEFKNWYWGKNKKRIMRPYICLPEDDVVNKKSAKKAKKANEKIHKEWDKKGVDALLDEMMGRK